MPATSLHLRKTIVAVFLFPSLMNPIAAQQKIDSSNSNFKIVFNKTGPVLGYAPASGIKILTIKGLHFKDLNKNGKLDKYED
ncbi:MAG: beta-glucosidase [Ferruginibacter sp.]|nr:beta-glucosidase [Ferruginibacter sp.]